MTIGVPTVIIGDTVLIGSINIQQDLPKIIEDGLKPRRPGLAGDTRVGKGPGGDRIDEAPSHYCSIRVLALFSFIDLHASFWRHQKRASGTICISIFGGNSKNGRQFQGAIHRLTHWL